MNTGAAAVSSCVSIYNLNLYFLYKIVGIFSVDSDDIPGIGQYEDFHTIDWQRDIARDRMRHRYILKRKQNSIIDLVKGAHDAWSGWLCVLLVGVVTGAVAGIIDIGSSWMSDLKFGVCPNAFWLNMEQCCWAPTETSIGTEKGNCSQVILDELFSVNLYFLLVNFSLENFNFAFLTNFNPRLCSKNRKS